MKHIRLATAALIAPLLLAATACSADKTEPEVASITTPAGGDSTPAAAAGDDNVLKFAQCMRENGQDVDDQGMPAGASADGQFDMTSEFIAANEKCAAQFPGKPIGQDSADIQASNEKLAQCMRDNGVSDWPDPLAPGQTPTSTTGGMVSSDGSGFDLPASIDMGSPTVQKALEECMGGAGMTSSGSAGTLK